jgi:predicted HTH transcriptional regulator
VTLLGPPLHELTLEDLQRFIDDADAEPLLWEAKGTELSKEQVRSNVCAFASGRDVAYLLLGAERDGGRWRLSGVEVPGGDPPAWVSDVIGAALRPVPQVDVKPLPVDGRHVVVVEVPPVAIPPCISNGTVRERVSGRTIAVKDRCGYRSYTGGATTSRFAPSTRQ